MSRWIKREYEGVVLFLFTIIGAFIPWGGTRETGNFLGSDFTILTVRWWAGNFIHISGLNLGEDFNLRNGFESLLTVMGYHDEILITSAEGLWVIGGVLYLVLLLFVVVLFFNEDAVRSRVPIHLVGGTALLIISVVFTISHYQFMQVDGLHVPVGVFFYFLFGLVLVTNRIGTESDENEIVDEDVNSEHSPN